MNAHQDPVAQVDADAQSGHEPDASPPPPAPARNWWLSLRRRAGEVAIVTVGILIAFALDAWWDSRAQAREEQIHLRALVSDMQQNVTALKALLETEEKIMAGSRELLERARAEPVRADAPLQELFNQVFNSGRYDPVMGAYEALVNSGGLTLIRDETVRAALAGFAAKVRGRYTESWSDEHYFAFAREFAGRVMLMHAREMDAAAREQVLREMLREPRFQEHLAMRYYSERDMASRYRYLHEQAEQLLSQLQEQVQDLD